MENLDNLKMPELLEAIVRIKAETEVIKKEAEAIRKETEAIKKEREIESKKNQDKIEKMRQENLELDKKYKEEQKIREQIAEEKHEKMRQENLELDKKYKEEQKIREQIAEEKYKKMRQENLELDKKYKEEQKIREQLAEEKYEKMRQENLELDKKYKEEQKIMNQHLYSLGITIGFGLEDGMFNLLESNLTLEDIKYDSIQKNRQYHDPITKQTLAEADLILLNGQHAAIIEIKHRLTLKILLDFYNKKIPIFINNERHLVDKKIHFYFATESYEDAVIPEAQKLGIGIVEPGYNDIISILKAA